MLSIPPLLIRAASKADQTSPWLILLDVVLPDSSVLYLVNNNEDIVFQGNTYLAFSFSFSGHGQDSKGKIPSVTITMSNVTGVIQQYMEANNGLVGCPVTLRLVHVDHLAEDYSSLTLNLEILAPSANAKTASFVLGPPNPLKKRFPVDQYIAMHCRFAFKTDPRCGYTGTATECNRTLDQCRALGNSGRFGGHPGLDGRGVRLV